MCPALFGRRVRLLREAAGLTQEQLGKAAGVDFKHVGSIERGEKTASFEAVEKLANALGVSYYELFLPDDLSAGAVDEDRVGGADGTGRVTARVPEKQCSIVAWRPPMPPQTITTTSFGSGVR